MSNISKKSKKRLFRLRSLLSKDDTDRVIQSVVTNKFWCSSFADLNDPMEGVFRTNSITDLKKLTSEKNKFKICCFTDIYGVRKPSMWGYYAGSFRGIALEISYNNSDIKKIKYKTEIPWIPKIDNPSFRQIFTIKLKPWKHEREFRFIKNTEANLNEIGKVEAIHCYIPYENADNSSQIRRKASTIKTYLANLRKLQREINGDIPIYVASFDKAKNWIKLSRRNLRDLRR